MAIQKKLLHFNDKSNFEIQLERGNILDTSIVFIKNTKQIWTHGQYYDSLTDEIINQLDNIPTKVSQLENDSYYISNKSSEANVGDAVLVNKTTLEKVAVNPNKLSNYSVDEWEPIGVVVIPSSHDVYGTGECGVVALMSASLTTPDTGQTSNVSMCWGAYGTDYPELNNFDKVCKVGIESGAQKVDAIVNNELTSLISASYLPSDAFPADSQHTKAIDGTYYYLNDSNWNNCLPSPYLEDVSRNPVYYQTDSPSTTANALSDFAGKFNTEFLCSKATSQENWRADETITDNYNAGYHPAACACWRFHTVGTSQGDWYLPACGELGYCCVRYKLINETIAALQTWSGNTYCLLITRSFWSSSESSYDFACYVSFTSGIVSRINRGYSCYVRPFLRLSFNSELNDILSNYYTKEESDSTFANKDEILNKSVLEVTSNILSEDFTTCTIENTGINAYEDRLLYISYYVDSQNAEGNIVTEKSYIPLYLEKVLEDSVTPCKLLFSNITGDYKYTAVQKTNSTGEITDTWVVTKEPLYKHLKSVINLNSTENIIISQKDVDTIHTTVHNGGVVLANSNNSKTAWAYLINYQTLRGDTYLTFIDGEFIYKVYVAEGGEKCFYQVMNKEKLKLTNISDLTNDSGFITNTALESYYTKTETLEQVNTKIQEVVGAAPEALDTLEEIAAKLNEDSDAIDAINGVLTGKATKEEVNSKVSKTGDETIDGNKTFSNNIKVGTNKVWHEGNDGPGSGLDADTLDGYHIGNSYDKIAPITNFPSTSKLNELGYLDQSDNTKSEPFLKAICKWVSNLEGITDYSTFGGILIPNSRKWCRIHIYGGSELVDGMRKYITGDINDMEGYTTKFGTYNGKWYYYSIPPIPDPTSANNGNILQVINGKYQLANISLEDQLSYGVEWDVNVADPHLTRIGNMNFHRTLPIQSGMKGCIAQGSKVIYWLDENDWRFKANRYTTKITAEQAVSIPKDTSGHILNYSYGLAGILLGVVGENVTTELTPVTQSYYIKINGIICKVNGVNYDYITTDVYNNDVQLTPISGDLNIQQGETMQIELGSRLWGIDGEVKVYVPEFWIKSEIDGNKRRVRITTMKIDDTWTHQPALLVGAYRSTVLNTVPENMGYLSTLPVNSAISVVNTAIYCRGGSNRANFDQYLEGVEASEGVEAVAKDIFRTDLGKPRTTMSRPTMRTYSRNAGNEMLSYNQYKNIFYWLYVVEYANFNCQEAYNATLTEVGYHQGGMGHAVTTMNNNYWRWYNGCYPLTPCGYCNEFGNGTGIKDMVITAPSASDGSTTQTYTFQVPRWRGFDNPFGDIWTNLDGIVIERTTDLSNVWTTDDVSEYIDVIGNKTLAGKECLGEGYIKLFDLGETAEIIPSVNGGGANTTQYKCDYHWRDSNTSGLRTLFVGGSASSGGNAGLSNFDSLGGVSYSGTYVGFRSVSPFVSSQATETV